MEIEENRKYYSKMKCKFAFHALFASLWDAKCFLPTLRTKKRAIFKRNKRLLLPSRGMEEKGKEEILKKSRPSWGGKVASSPNYDEISLNLRCGEGGKRGTVGWPTEKICLVNIRMAANLIPCWCSARFALFLWKRNGFSEERALPGLIRIFPTRDSGFRYSWSWRCLRHILP